MNYPEERWGHDECAEWRAQSSDGGLWCTVTRSTDVIVDDYCSDVFGAETDDDDDLWNNYGPLFLSLSAAQEVGIGLDNNYVLLSLLCLNVVTILFVIVALNQLTVDIDIRTITSILTVMQCLLLSSYLMVFSWTFSTCDRPSMFHCVDFVLCSTLCFVWIH